MQYGGVAAANAKASQAKSIKHFGPRRYRRMNIVAIVASLFGPWALFSLLLAVLSSERNYLSPTLCSAVSLVVLCLCFACFLVVALRRLRLVRRELDVEALSGVSDGYKDPRQANWHLFFWTTALIASVVAIYVGNWNFVTNMQPHYNVQNLNNYQDVDVAATRGQELMDAGTVVFKKGTEVDVDRFVGFRNVHTFCVAPIGQSATSELSNYDFWAVGTDCCGDASAGSKFTCGQIANPRAHAGVRAMKEGDRAFYRLAVQEAISTYNIRSTHPLFFHWTEDPAAQVASYKLAGYKVFLTGMYCHFAIQLFLVLVATCIFAESPSLA